MKLDRTYISLGVAIWAAAGKHESFTPAFLLDRIRRSSLINPATLDGQTLAEGNLAVKLKKDWLERFDTAEKLMPAFPFETLGCLYIDTKGESAKGDVFDLAWLPHYGGVKGAWPKIAE